MFNFVAIRKNINVIQGSSAGRKPLSKMLFFAGSNIIFEDDIVVDGSLGVSQQRHWHPSEMTCADQRVDPSFEAAEAVNIH